MPHLLLPEGFLPRLLRQRTKLLHRVTDPKRPLAVKAGGLILYGIHCSDTRCPRKQTSVPRESPERIAAIAGTENQGG